MTNIKKLMYASVILIGIQFIPYGKEHNNPIVKTPVTWDTEQTKTF